MSFSEKNITTKRPGNGISPMEWYNLLGKIFETDFIQDHYGHGEFKNQGGIMRTKIIAVFNP